MTKTDNILRIITIIKNGAVRKEDLKTIIGKSRAQTYKIIAEFTQATDVRPPVLVEYTHNGQTFVQLSSHFGLGRV